MEPRGFRGAREASRFSVSHRELVEHAQRYIVLTKPGISDPAVFNIGPSEPDDEMRAGVADGKDYKPFNLSGTVSNHLNRYPKYT